MSLETGWSSMSPYDPRQNQIPVYLSAAAASLYASYYAPQKYKVRSNFHRRWPLAVLVAGANAAVSYKVWQKTVLREARAKEYGTWKSCPDCDAYKGFAVGFVVNGLVPIASGAATTVLFETVGSGRRLPRSSVRGPQRILRFWIGVRPPQVAFGTAVFGLVFGWLRISHEKKNYRKYIAEKAAQEKEEESKEEPK